jgi:hypothetical protein
MCDCYRNDNYTWIDDVRENRYFIDSELNLSISYFQFSGVVLLKESIVVN